jgi:hypothetical protein
VTGPITDSTPLALQRFLNADGSNVLCVEEDPDLTCPLGALEPVAR